MKNNLQNYSYVLITPARNEEKFIEKTIQSVISQTILPIKWIIVSDGSTDRTDEIVGKYIKENTWIELLRMPERKKRHFAGKAHCFNAGYENHKVTEIAHIVKAVVGDDLEIATETSNDNRSYHISSAKIEKELGFKPQHTIEEAVHDLHEAFKNGKLPNSMNDKKYFNIKTMQSLQLQ